MPLPCAHLDAIARRQWRWRDGDLEAEHALDQHNTWDTLQRSEWDTVSLHCHGDGAHANFNSVVLCGIPAAQEIGRGGWRAECALNAESARCKRVHGVDKRPFRFGDLRTRRICLFTCNGFSVAGDVYPSEASFVLSASEGYCAAIMTTDRRLRFESWLFRAVHSMLDKGRSLTEIATLLNDLHAYGNGPQPYLLFGDPAHIDPVPQPVRDGGGRKGKAEAGIWVGELGNLSKCKVLGIDLDPPQIALQRGVRMALIADARGCANPALVDRTTEFERFNSWIVRLTARLRRSQRLRAAVLRHHPREVETSGAIWGPWCELLKLSRRLEFSVDEGVRLLAEIRQRGVWSRSVQTWRSHALLLVGMWDAQFSQLLDEHLLESDLHELLRDGFCELTTRAGSACPRCGCTLTEGSAAAPFIIAGKHRWHDCPTCGPREAWDQGLPRLEARPPNSIYAGGAVRMPVRLSRTAHPPLDPTGAGFLVTHLKDSGRGLVSYRNVERIPRRTCTLNIKVPSESTLEIHTLRLAFVRELGVTYLRLRTPCLPKST